MRRGALILVLLAFAGSGVFGAAPASSARPGFVEPPTVSVGDSDGDGLAEASAGSVAGGPCACWCPILTGGGEAVMFGQVVGVDTRSALVVCGTRARTTVDPNAPDPGQTRGFDGRWDFNPGGFAPRLPRR